MNENLPLAISAVALALGGAAVYVSATSTGPKAPNSAKPSLVGQDIAAKAMNDRLQSIEADLKSLTDRYALAPLDSGGRTAVDVDEDAIRRAVEAYFLANPAAGAASDDPGAPREPKTVADFVELLKNANGDDAAAIWKRIIEQGLSDDVLAHYKRVADAAPNDPEAQLALGQAYLGKTQLSSGVEAGKFATLADKALDRALEVDPEHWEARFTKAIALSFWPAAFNKQPQAIRELETLVQQQAGTTASEEHAQTHLILGNLYSQRGEMEQALTAWRAGLAIFPNNAELNAQVSAAGGGH